jgi:hypothetical protein
VIFEELPPSPNMPGGHDEEWWREKFHQFASKCTEWRRTRDTLYESKDTSKPAMTTRSGRKTKVVTVGELREFADHQYREADKLLRKLDRYASGYAVPMEWREY